MGVAATWSRSTAEQNGLVIGRDARSLGIDVVLQPFINIDRDIAFARSYNTFGEDPFLAGEMGAAEIRGVQSQRVMAQAKYYVGYDTGNYDVAIDPQTLHEVYVAPFAAAVTAGVSSIMCSYSRVNGQFACGNGGMLQNILRKELGFKGFVTSAWGAVHNVRYINRGLDMEMPGDLPAGGPALPFNYFQSQPPSGGFKVLLDPRFADPGGLNTLWDNVLPEEPKRAPRGIAFPRDMDLTTLAKALQEGAVTEPTVTAAARHVLCELDRFGYLDGKQKSRAVPGGGGIEANAKVIEATAVEAAVLLKNQDRVLPLQSADLSSLALIGPTAGQVAAIGLPTERSPGLVQRQVGPVEALKRSAPEATVTFAVDDDMTGVPIPATALSHDGKPGLERRTAPATTAASATADTAATTGTPATVGTAATASTVATAGTAVDETLNFTGRAALPPDSNITWNGDLSVASAGNYWLYLQVLGGRAVLTVDGREVGRTGAVMGALRGDVQHPTQDNILPTVDGLDNVRRAVQLEAGKHAFSVQLTPDTSHAPAEIRLNWMTPEARVAAHAQAIEAARNAHTVVVFVWTRGQPVFGLPGEQNKLVEEVAAVNPNTIVVLNTSQPVALPWLDRVKGVVQMWWPGDEGGWATAKILLGKANPSGHLPFTWARRLEDYPATDPAHPERSSKGVKPEGRRPVDRAHPEISTLPLDPRTTFSEGLLVGYRWFDHQHIEPVFPFGFGLSYSTYEVVDASGKRTADGGATVRLRVRNSGKLEGDMVPQLYLEAPSAPVEGIAFAPRTLVGFERLRLAPGATREITVQVAPRAFQYWSEAARGWQTPAGSRVIRVGLSSRELVAAVTLQ
jgi:beta-glucosidase